MKEKHQQKQQKSEHWSFITKSKTYYYKWNSLQNFYMTLIQQLQAFVGFT